MNTTKETKGKQTAKTVKTSADSKDVKPISSSVKTVAKSTKSTTVKSGDVLQSAKSVKSVSKPSTASKSSIGNTVAKQSMQNNKIAIKPALADKNPKEKSNMVVKNKVSTTTEKDQPSKIAIKSESEITKVGTKSSEIKKMASVSTVRKKPIKTVEKSEVDKEKNINTNKSSSLNVKEDGLRNKLSKNSMELQDLEKLNEENLKTYRIVSRRNQVFIILLSLLLLVSIVGVGLYFSFVHKENNCFLYTHGDASAVYLVQGGEITSFRTPANIKGNRTYNLNIDLKIQSSGKYNVKFNIQCYEDGDYMENILVYEPNRDLFTYVDGYYESKQQIFGSQVIRLCEGVIIDMSYEHTLNSENFRMEFHTYVTEAQV